MGKPSKPKPTAPKKPVDPERRRRWRMIGLNALWSVLFLAACAGSFYAIKRYVDRRVLYTDRAPTVVLLNRPVWMSDHLAQRIADSVQPRVPSSVLNRQVLVDVARILHADPWIKEVRQVRRAYRQRPGDTLEIDCDYHIPIALVKVGELYYLVDNNAVLLPESYTASQVPLVVRGLDRQVNIRIITGVRGAKPKTPGEQWNGDDLIAGLELARCLYGQPFAEEIELIDVANFQERVDRDAPQLVLITRHGTQVRWGRPIHARDFFVEIGPERKLERMRMLYDEYRRVDGGFPWVDLRFDRVFKPSADQPAQASSRR